MVPHAVPCLRQGAVFRRWPPVFAVECAEPRDVPELAELFQLEEPPRERPYFTFAVAATSGAMSAPRSLPSVPA
jgi:hypothetical protein